MATEEEEEEEEETLNRHILSSLRQAVFLVFLQMLISLYALWKPPLSEALIEKLDELLKGITFPLSQFEGIKAFKYDELGNLTEILEQDKSLAKKKKITLSYDAQGNLRELKEEWIKMEKGEA